MAASSVAFEIKYDIFLSFKGTDTRRGFLSHLIKALNHKQIESFVDYKLKEGTEISPSLLTAIEESQISLIIFSQDYASSKWCLDELVKIIKCMKENGHIAIPIFYDVDPSWVRKQKGSYHDALAKHEKTSSGDKVQNWRKALKEAANLSGLHSSNFGNEVELIDEIIKRVLQRLNKTCQGDLQGLVGIHEPIAQLESVLCAESRSVLIIGLWGMGGIGKTTLASAVFNKLCHEFQGFCFLNNVRDKKYGLNHLKKELLSKLLKEKDVDPFIMPSGIANFAKRRLQQIKVLVVLDDVSDPDQLEYLCGGHKWFGPTSRIMVTTRDKHVLLKEADHIHEVKALNFDDALQLFKLNAFIPNYIETKQVELSMRVVNYAKGIPLALKVLGSSLYGKSKKEWESQLAKLKKMPHEKIQNVLRLSYNELDRDVKNIFLYLACFFETTTEEQITFLLDSCGYSTTIGLRTLQDKALIYISRGCVTMHDLIREMGREVVREESPDDPGKRSRLWDPTDIYKVLKYNRGTKAIESITLNMSKIDVLSLHPHIFARMYKLKFLDIHSRDGKHRLCAPEGIESLSNELRIFHWDNYPSKSLPLSFCAENLVEIIMPNSRLEKLWEGVQNLLNLKKVDLNWSLYLIQLPDFSKASNLEEVNISNCKSLRRVHPSIVSSHKLVYAFLHDCNELSSFQHNIHQQSLKTLSFNNCTSLMEFLLTTYESPSSLTQLDTDTSILLTPLERLKFDYCSNLSLLPDNISMLSSLKNLSLCHSNVKSLPESIKHMSQLKYLNLRNCKRLQSLPELPSSIVRLIVVNCTSLQTVFASNSMGALIKEEQSKYETFAYANCIKLEEPAINIIMVNALVRIKRAAYNTCLTTIQENEDDGAFNQHYDHRVQVCLPGSKVPSWFSYRTRQTSMTIELVPYGSSNSRLLGFILCVIPPPNKNGMDPASLRCEYCIEASNGKKVKHTSLLSLMHWELAQEGNNVYFWYDGQCCYDITRGMKESKANDEDKFHNLKVSFNFYCANSWKNRWAVKQCGVHPIYASNIHNIGEQWQIESRSGIKSNRRAKITKIRVTSINSMQSSKNNEDKNAGNDTVLHSCDNPRMQPLSPGFSVVLTEDFSSFLSANDATLLAGFAATHEDFILPLTDPLPYRQAAYKSFVCFYHFLASHTLLELLTQQKEFVGHHLQALSCFGFSGVWFERMAGILSQDVPPTASEDLAPLLTEEDTLSTRVFELQQEASSLSKRLEIVNLELASKNTELEQVMLKKISLIKARAAFDAPYLP